MKHPPRFCGYSTQRKEQHTAQELIEEKYNFSNLSDHATKCHICHCTWLKMATANQNMCGTLIPEILMP